MVRSTAIAVLLFLLVPLCLPLAPPRDESSLPACCRRDGKHRCGMAWRLQSSTQDQTNGPAVRSAAEPCPYRSALFGPIAPHAMAAPAQKPAYAPPLPYSAAIAQTVLLARISEARSHHKRGPPSFKA
jgi:hypothetical protein